MASAVYCFTLQFFSEYPAICSWLSTLISCSADR